MKVVSFFSGCGGLDLGFENAGFDVIWANEFDKTICPTYAYNHPNVVLNDSDIKTLSSEDIPDCDGFIGGPPCQAWSEGGKGLGLKDERGKVFLEYIRLIKEKQPKFFLIENVPGILSAKHKLVFGEFLSQLKCANYKVSYQLLNAKYYQVSQDRERVFVVGIRNDIDVDYTFPTPTDSRIVTLRESIGDIKDKPMEYQDEEVKQFIQGKNHDVYVGVFDDKYMSRNRVRSWNNVSYTIQAQAKNEPLHPQAPRMQYVSENKRIFVKGYEHLYRRLSVRECARIQSFPDSFKFLYSNVKDGYKMVGNAVPPKLSYVLAKSIKECFERNNSSTQILVGYYKGATHLNLIMKNNLYYFPFVKDISGSVSYLLLHHKENFHLYKVKDNSLSEKDNKSLIEMGFNPTKRKYQSLVIEGLVEDCTYIINYCKKYTFSYAPTIVKIPFSKIESLNKVVK